MNNSEVALPAPLQMSAVQYNLDRLAANRARALIWLKRGIWLYFWLLLFEGALRKWVLPGLSTPLLIVRDPIAIWILGYAYIQGMFKINPYITLAYIVTVVSIITTLTLGHGNFVVALYGARIMLFHFPLIFIIGRLFSNDDVVQIGKAMLWAALPITLLMAAQFYSPQTAWVNWSVGGVVEKYGFGGSLGFFRPSGPFSFTNGLSGFFGLLSPFIFCFWLNGTKAVPKWLLIIGTICLLISIPFSISRTLFFQVLLVGAFVFLISTQKPSYIGKIVMASAGVLALLFILIQLGFFQTGIDAFTNRFETASEIEGGVQGTLGDRLLGGLIGAISTSGNFPFWGLGLGMGTNAGSQLLSGKVQFLISEGEWGRLIGEMGILLGLVTILLRVNLAWRLGTLSFRQIKNNNFLPWLIFSYAVMNILQGQWAQPTSLGFSVLAGGLVIAALKPATETTPKKNLKPF